MECAESINLLSDLYDGSLNEVTRTQVQTHLAECPPCANIFGDLGEIVNMAVALNFKQEIAFPDEDALWQRMRKAGLKVQ